VDTKQATVRNAFLWMLIAVIWWLRRHDELYRRGQPRTRGWWAKPDLFPHSNNTAYLCLMLKNGLKNPHRNFGRLRKNLNYQ
jgi:hypothetical protein